jgi:hypothetical protein
MKQNPFSLYDFLGYFIPGTTLIYVVYIINSCRSLKEVTFTTIIESFPKLQFEGIVFIMIMGYLIGHVFSYLSSITVEKYAVWRYGYPSRYLLDMTSPKYFDHFKTFRGCFWGIVMIIVLLPTMILDLLLGNLLGFKSFYTQKLDDVLCKLVKAKVNKLTQLLGISLVKGLPDRYGEVTDFFRIVQHYTYDNSKNHQNKFTNYVALYGFLRTLTLIFNLIFWYLIVHLFFVELTSLLFILIITISLVAYILFMSFMKFYRRYTLEGFMVLVVDKEIK